MIELENVSMTYPGGNQALKNVNINIEKGEFVFIVEAVDQARQLCSGFCSRSLILRRAISLLPDTTMARSGERIYRRSEEGLESYSRTSDC